MRLRILAVGRLKSGPERDLVDEYLKRAAPIARQLGFRGIEELEVAGGGSLSDEAQRLVAKLPTGDAVCVRLDEHGPSMSSRAFSKWLADHRDRGIGEAVFLIGGADGYGPEIRQAVPTTLSYGTQTWPHRLVRVMLAEQIYRAVSIESGSPYHKA